MQWPWIIAFTFSGFLASLATNSIGVGGGLLVMPTLALWFPARQVVVFTTPMFLANAIATWYNYRYSWKVPRTLWTIPWVLMGIVIGVHFLVNESTRDLDITIGLIALIFVVYEVIQRTLRKQVTGLPGWVGIPIALTSGGISAISNIGGTLLSLYVLSPEVTPDGFVGSLALLYVIMTSAKLCLFWFHHLILGQTFLWSLPSIPSIIVGSLVGKKIHRGINPSRFRLIVIGVIFISSLALLLSSI